MRPRKIRAFLGTDVILEYVRGVPEVQRLFSKKVRDRVEFVIDSTVINQLAFIRDKKIARAAFQKVDQLEITQGGAFLSSSQIEELAGIVRDTHLHVSAVFAANGARSCDVLLTYNPDLVRACEIFSVRAETPDAFLQELNAAA